jgi:hypothetical protein
MITLTDLLLHEATEELVRDAYLTHARRHGGPIVPWEELDALTQATWRRAVEHEQAGDDG